MLKESTTRGTLGSGELEICNRKGSRGSISRYDYLVLEFRGVDELVDYEEGYGFGVAMRRYCMPREGA